MTIDIETARAKRQRLSKAASQLASVSDRVACPTGRITAAMIEALPDWCCEDINTIRKLQLTAGALYFAPQISTSIDGRLLREFKAFVGDECFEFVRHSYQAQHEPASNVGAQRLPIAVMAAGSAVLLSTLPDIKLVSMYEQVIGPASVNVDSQTGQKIIADSGFLLLEKPATAFEQ
ncbi:MAG: hypothetical protein AAF404_08945 [Pseudomonadota bacterium]